jgi:PAS domain S-box-containing protein
MPDHDADRARAEEILRESEARVRSIADHAPVLIWLNNLDGCEFVNREYLQFCGGTLDDVRASGWRSFLHPEDAETYEGAYTRSLEQRVPFEARYRLRAADGSYRWFQAKGSPRYSETGEFLGYVGCSVDVTDIKNTEDLLKEADRRKDEFLATLAHELRNPLAPIRNALRVLRLSNSSESRDRAHAMLERQVEHMVRLVEDLMEVSRITRGKVELRRSRVDLRTIIDIAVETCQPLIDAGRHRLSVVLPSPAPALEADAVRLVQVFANLIANAAKFSEEGGQISVTGRLAGDRIVVSVRDEGIGMSPETLATVFDLFVQGRDSTGVRRGGLGIGLTLVRSTVEMHGGHVEAKSDGEGRGSEFLVSLPVGNAHADHDRVSPPPALAPPSLAGHRVLVVDDHQDGADSLGMMLDVLGASTLVVYNGPAAIERIDAFRPGVAFLDIGMPRMDGYEVARRIRARPEHRDMTLIALTGWGQAEDRQRSLEAGFDYHLVKPLEMDTLRTVMASLALLRGRHERRMPAGNQPVSPDAPSDSRTP